ncbi:MAG: hypothetical protein F4107_13475 [Gemmatimonadetes bacterium]|nr:hypothetical protein [Gemmatimonadota bacterium]MYD14180.1 hypothetical protein [Gemmatimonadota bacterium]MYI66926.1 hypothetical protein [Gemmatimonadota bacterium]
MTLCNVVLTLRVGAEGDRGGFAARASSAAGLLLLAATATVLACDGGGTGPVGEPNRPPQPAGVIPPLEVFAGDSAAVELSGHFRDPDGDPLTHRAASSDEVVAVVRAVGSEVVVRGVSQGVASVTVTATDPGGLSGTQTFAVVVPNRGPEAVGEIPDIVVEVGDSVARSLAGLFQDPDGDGLTFSAASSDTSVAGVAVIDDEVVVAARARGAATVIVTARDAGGLDARHTFEVTVPNRAPVVLERLPDGRLPVGDTMRADLSPHFSDPDADSLDFAATTSAAHIATAAVTGATLTIAALAAGTAAISVTASDSGGLAATLTLTVVVPNRAPEPLGTIPDTTVTPGDTLTLFASRHFRDPDGNPLSYTVRTSRRIRVSATVADSTVTLAALSVGSSTITLTASDPGGLSATQRFRVTIEPPPRPDLIVDSAVADVDSIAPGGRITLSAIVRNRGDGDSASPTTLRFVQAYIPRITPGDVQAGTFAVPQLASGATVAASVEVTAPDDPGTYFYGACVVPLGDESDTRNNCSAGVQLRVWQPNRAPRAVGAIRVPPVRAGASLSVDAVPYFDDPDGDTLSYSATSSAPSVARVSVSGSAVTVSALSPGRATITVAARDPGGLAAAQSFDVTVQATPSPDLVVQFSVSATGVGPGDPFTLEATVRNQGGAASSPAALHYYLSSDARISTADAPLGTDPVGRLDPFRTSSKSLAVNAPHAAGYYYYGACIDVLANESDRSNNCSDAVAVQVTQANRAPRPNGAIPGRAVILGQSAAIEVSAYFTDPDLDALSYAAASSDTLTARATAAGSTVGVTAVRVGRATITVTATDPGGFTATQSFAVSVEEEKTPLPDLVVEAASVSVADSVEAGGRFTLGARVRNAGDGAAAATTLRYYRSEDATITTFDTGVGTDAVGGLGAGGSSAETIGLDAPAVPGTYYYGACADALGSETDVGNNCSAAVELRVWGRSRPDLVVTSAMASVNPVAPSTAFALTAVVLNRGTGTPSAPTRLHYYRSPDAAISTADMEIGDSAVGALAASGSATRSFTATSPAAAGTYYYGACVDAVSGETDDTNNCSAAVAVRVRQPNRAPRITVPIPDIGDARVGETLFTPLAYIFSDPDGDELAYTTTNTNDAAATVRVDRDTIFVEALAVGSTAMSVKATDPEGLSATDSWNVTVISARVPETFTIELGFTDAVTEAQKEDIRAARDIWEGILADTELFDVTYNRSVECLGLSAFINTLDDHIAYVDVLAIDGPGGTLAQATYCRLRLLNGVPAGPTVSAIQFDEADIERVRAAGALEDLALHELAHGLGFVDHYWSGLDLVDTAAADPHFTGAGAVAAFDSAGGDSYIGNKVPISSPDHSHWREPVFGEELMTPVLVVGSAQALSAITLEAMADFGYVVDVSQADDYELPGARPPGALAERTGQVLHVGDDVIHGPVTVDGPDGRTIRVIPPPAGSAPVPRGPAREVRIEIRPLRDTAASRPR